MNDQSPEVAVAPENAPQRVSFRLPLTTPRWSYVLLALNVLVWLAMGVAGVVQGVGLNGSQNIMILLQFGAQKNTLVAQGEFWRLLTSMFLHIGLIHLLFNSWALYVLGRDVEALYGAPRFLAIYLLSGLGGSLVFYLLGDDFPSAGASGAIFGLIGVLIAYFLVHREVFGQSGRRQLQNLLLVTGANLFIGFTVPGINNLAHIGGLAFGAWLGWLLAPQYVVPDLVTAGGGTQTLVDRSSLRRQAPALALAVLVLATLVITGTARWTNSTALRLEQAVGLLEAEDYAAAAPLLRVVVEETPNDGIALFYLGVAEANLGDTAAAGRAWERSVTLQPEIAGIRWNLALVYLDMGRTDDALQQLQEYLRLASSEEERAQAQALIQELSR